MSSVLLWTHRLAGAEGRTGVGRYVVELTRALAAEPGAAGLSYELCAGVEREQADWIPAGVGVRRMKGNRRLVHLAWAAVGRPPIERLAGPADLVHAMAPSFPLPARAPRVVTIHDLFPLEHPEWSGRAAGWANRRGMRWAFAEADHIVTVSAHVRDKILGHGVEPGRVTVCHEGIADRFGTPVPDATRDAVLADLGVTAGRYVLAVGVVSNRKDLPTVVDAVTRLPPPLDLVVAGPPGDGQEALLAAVERHRAGGRVRVAGFVRDEALRALIGSALALVHPSLDEGFGFTPLEAMAAGTPAIVAASGSLPEVVGDAAVVVPAGDPEAWAAAIDGLRADPDRVAGLVAAGRARAAGFTWARTAAATAAVHRAVLSGRSPA